MAMVGLKISARISPAIFHCIEFADFADIWIAPNGVNVTAQDYQRFTALAKQWKKPYRGAHLYPRYVQRSLTWDQAKEYARYLTQLQPDATSWDVIHECFGVHKLRTKWWNGEDEFFEWAKDAIAFAHEIAPNSTLFLSELRPQDQYRWSWVLALMDRLDDAGFPLDGISVQLHSNLMSRQPKEIEYLPPLLKDSGHEVHCFETMVFDMLAAQVPHRPPSLIAEQWQYKRYQWYKQWATSAGATMYGPWHLWDGVREQYWQPIETNPGIIRADGTLKPSWDIFRGES